MQTFALDVETSKEPLMFPWQTGSFCVAVGLTSERDIRSCFVLNHDEDQLYSIHRSGDIAAVKRYLNQRELLNDLQEQVNDCRRLVGHNLKFDLNWLSWLGIDTTHCEYYCTQVAEYILNGQRGIGKLSLKDLSQKYLNVNKIDKVKMLWDAGYETSEIPLNVLIPYLEQDCINALAIYQRQVPIIKKENFLHIVSLQCEAARPLSDIECNGMCFDLTIAKKHAADLTRQLEEIDSKLFEGFGFSININSTDELSAALYGGIIKRDAVELVEKERWAVKKEPYTYVYKDGRTTTKERNKRYREKYQIERKCVQEYKCRGLAFEPPKGSELDKAGYYSTSKDTIKQLKCTTKHQKIVKRLLQDRSAIAKAAESLIGKNSEEMKGLINKVMVDHCVHPSYNQTVTKTGRLSSSDPNGQNIPREGTSPLKECFIPRFDYLLGVDLSSIEWRVAAFLSQDPVMIQEILAGIDPHRENAIAIFGADPSGDPKRFDELRTLAKIVTFRLLYGGSAYGFYRDAKMPSYTLKIWTQIVEAFYAKYKVLKQWQEDNISLVYEQKGILYNPTGRKFVFHKGEKGYKPSQIKNFPVQSLATADIMILCMVLIHREFIERKFESLLIGQIHDELVFDTYKDETEQIAVMCITIMRKLPQFIEEYFGFKFDIPLDGAAEYSATSWGHMRKLEV